MASNRSWKVESELGFCVSATVSCLFSPRSQGTWGSRTRARGTGRCCTHYTLLVVVHLPCSRHPSEHNQQYIKGVPGRKLLNTLIFYNKYHNLDKRFIISLTLDSKTRILWICSWFNSKLSLSIYAKLEYYSFYF